MSLAERDKDRFVSPDELSSKLARLDDRGNDEEKLRLLEESDSADSHDDKPQKEGQGQKEPVSKGSFASSLAWMVINTLATIGIVFTNKAIFSDPSLKLAQLSFAAFHFLITYLTLFTLSRPAFAFFMPRRTPFLSILPLSLTMTLNVILPNLSLAFSTVTFYQIARILLTPTVALLNYTLYHTTLPLPALLALIPTCAGVAAVSYYDSLPTNPASPPSSPSPSLSAVVERTTPLGILFALSGTLASALYTTLISASHRRLRLSSMQLLYNQAPLSFLLLLYAIPFLDVLPTADSLLSTTTPGRSRLGMVLLSGLLAAVINISQFFIVARTGAVSSTVVGHVKTCLIVALGWVRSGRGVGDGSLVGVVVAVGGIVAYSVIMLREKERQAASKGER